MKDAGDTPRTELYLVVEAADGVLDRIRAALGASHPATVLFAPAPGTKLDAPSLKPAIDFVQDKGIPALVSDDPQLARTLKAGGVHLNWSRDLEARYAEARAILGTRYIIGASAIETRHEAMVLGESGIDYVAFQPASNPKSAGAWEDLLETVDWWAEIFEVPCVALGAATPEQVADLADAGADFVGVTVPAAIPVERIGELVTSAVAAIGQPAAAG